MTHAQATRTAAAAPATAAATAATHRPAAGRPPGGSEFGRLAFARAFTDPVVAVDPAVRSAVEQLAGAPLGPVRVHTGPHVRTAARAARAAAFTVGRDVGVAVGPGAPVPDALLTHELLHVVQQGLPGTASPAEAEAQALAGGPLSGTGREYPAYAAEDWLQGTPNVAQYGFSALVDELAAVNEWLARQTVGSQETDRMAEAKQALEAELARRRGAIRAAERPPPRARGRGRAATGTPAAPTAALPDATEMPRVLRDRTSMQTTDPDEIRTEVDRITAWLQRPDLTRADRSTLQGELAALAPGLGAELDRASTGRRQARLARAFSPSAGADRASILANLRLIESIQPYQAQPGTSYVMHEGELLVFPTEVGTRVRAEAVAALAQAASSAGSMNDSSQYRMSEHMRLNYEDQYVVGFFVSVVSGEEPVDVQRRMLDPLSNSNIALRRYRTAAARGSLVEMGDAVMTAVDDADRAQTIVLEGIDRAMAAAGSIVQGLTITRNLSFAIALSIGAILAAPVVAAGVAGTGATGLLATGMTTVGTAGVVGSEGFVLGFIGGGGGELAAGHGGHAALREGWGEGVRVGKQGVAIGAGGGASLGLARNLGVGAVGLTRTGQVTRSAVAGAGGNAFGSLTGAALSDVPEGQTRGGFLFRSTAWGAGLGAFGGAAGAGSQWLNPGIARFGVGVGLPSAAGAGASYLQTGDWSQSVQSGAQGLVLGGLSLRQPTGPTPAQVRAYGFGRSVTSTTRALTAATMLGVGNVGPVLGGGDSTPGSFTLSDPRQPTISAPAGPRVTPPATVQQAPVQQSPTPPTPVQQSVAPTTPVQQTPLQQTPVQQSPVASPTVAVTSPQVAAPRLELSDLGVRPAPGARLGTQAQYRQRMGAARWRAAVERAFAGDLEDRTVAPRVTGGQSDPRIGGKAVPGEGPTRIDIDDIPRQAGESQQQAVSRIRSVIGHTIAEFPDMLQAWIDARTSILSRRTLTQANSRDLFDATRNAFYRRLRNNAAAGQVLNDAGLELVGAATTAPRLAGAPAGTRAAELTVSLDHVVERAADWQRALDPANLQFEFAAPNTDREIVQMRHPELRPP